MKHHAHSTLIAAALCASLIALPAIAFAGDHGPGFMMRATIGPSYARIGQKYKNEDAQYNLHGASLNADLALGFALSGNFAIHATAAYWNMFNPTMEASVSDLKQEIKLKDPSLQNFGIGGGITTWSNSNLFFSVSVMASMLRGTYEHGHTDTDWGIGGEALLGKEWWLGGSVGLGLAAAATIHYIPSKNSAIGHHFGYTVGPRLTLTIN